MKVTASYERSDSFMKVTTLFFIWVTSGIRYIEASSEQHLNDIDEFNINRNGLIGAFTTRLRPNFTV